MATTKASINNGSFQSIVLTSTTTPSDGYDITDLVNEFNIFQSIEVPFLTANMLIVDSAGLLNNTFIIGNELITMNYVAMSVDGKTYDQSINFFITKIEKIEKQGTTTIYALTLGSGHFVANAHNRISQAYSGKSSDIIKKLFEDTLKLSEDEYDIEETQDNIKVVIPNLKISETLSWISRRALSLNNTPCFTFEHLDGSMSFNSLEKMYSRGALFKYYLRDAKTSDPLSTYFNINSFQVDSIGNSYTNIANGMFAAKVYAFDPLTREVIEHSFDVDKKELPMTTILNDASYDSGIKLDGKPLNELYDSKIFTVITTSNGSNNEKPEITSVHGNNGDYHSNSELKLPFINSKLLQLENFVITISIQGNTNIFPGSVISLTVPSTTNVVKNSEYMDDKYFSGSYIVLNIQHIFTAQSHMTILQLAKDSFKVN